MPFCRKKKKKPKPRPTVPPHPVPAPNPNGGKMEFPKIAIYNDQSSGEKDSDVEKMVAALQKQVDNDFEPRWHTRADLSFVPSTSKPPAGVWVISLLDNSDVAGALGYHDLTPDGHPLGKVFAGTDRQYGQVVSVTLSHELLEMLGDPWINLSAQADDGKFYAYEASDAVEADNLAYVIDGVKVSSFVCPPWFGHGIGDLCFPVGHVAKPFELAPGGYIGMFDPASGKGWTQVTAALREHASKVHRISDLAAGIPRVGSRRERRFRKATGGVFLPSTYETG